MSCLDKPASGNPGRAFCLFTVLGASLFLALFLFGLMHTSEQPQYLGRYSFPYLLFLLGLLLAAAFLAWVYVRGGPVTRGWMSNLYLLIVSASLTLLLVEWGLRALNPFGVEFFHVLPYHMQGMVDDPVLGYRHPVSQDYWLGRNHVVLNSRGLRDDEIAYEKPAGEKRILVLGDSVTFGWGVSQGQSFSDRLESLLREQTGQAWQVINAGVNGYNSEQEAAFLREEGLRYDPDAVLLVYVGNDVEPVFDPNETTWRRYPSWPDSLPEALNRIRQSSYLFQLTQLFTRMSQMDEARAAVTDGSVDESRHRSLVDHPRWPQSRAALLDIHRQCAEAGTAFAVALYSSLDGGHDPAFVADLREAGIDVFTLKPSWQGVAEELAHVSRIDSHPSALVHRKMAEYLAGEMAERGWLDAPAD